MGGEEDGGEKGRREKERGEKRGGRESEREGGRESIHVHTHFLLVEKCLSSVIYKRTIVGWA